ncbi:MAG: hypothetical protein OEW12_00830 [Deltaproteobacteria bacterium]|nr:hypothetical protein [Deltaproteobacteria bacterium]
MELLKASLQEAFDTKFRFTQKGFRPAKGPPPHNPASLRPKTPRPDGAWQAAVFEITELHQAYTGGGEFSGQRNPIHLRLGGTQFYYLPRNFYRVRHVLNNLPWKIQDNSLWQGAFGSSQVFKMADLGCGSGALSLAVVSWLSEGGAGAGLREVEISLVDQGRGVLEMAGENLRTFAAKVLPGVKVNIHPHRNGLKSFLNRPEEQGKYHLAGAAMALTELETRGTHSRRPAKSSGDGRDSMGEDDSEQTHRTNGLSRLIGLPKKGGLGLLVEPGTRKGYLNMLKVRDQLNNQAILYPCPHGLSCPLLDGAVTRWCHANLPLPDHFMFDDALKQKGKLSLHMEDLNLTGLVWQVGAFQPEYPFSVGHGGRVLSDVMSAGARKGGGGQVDAKQKILLVCMDDGKLAEIPAHLAPGIGRGGWVKREN